MSDWISIEEKMPEHLDLVLLFIKYPEDARPLFTSTIEMGYWNDKKKCWSNLAGYYKPELNLLHGHNVTHWQPLPEPPKQETT